MAAAALLEKKVKRIVLARPAVEAGERLGFLPGDLVEKINPYLRPLYDALYDILGYEKTAKLLERGIIEVAPIAFMRGRTLNDAFIILDEAQNTTSEQMKMFLTRIGFGSKAVVTGDVTQIDLPQGKTSGLREAQQLLSKIEGIRFVLFDERDVVRHPLVQSIITAYDALDREREAQPSRRSPRPLRHCHADRTRPHGARRISFRRRRHAPPRDGGAAPRCRRPAAASGRSPTSSSRRSRSRRRCRSATRPAAAGHDRDARRRRPARPDRSGPRRRRRGAGPRRPPRSCRSTTGDAQAPRPLRAAAARLLRRAARAVGGAVAPARAG